MQPTISLPLIDLIKVEKNWSYDAAESKNLGFSKLMQMGLIFPDKNKLSKETHSSAKNQTRTNKNTSALIRVLRVSLPYNSTR